MRIMIVGETWSAHDTEAGQPFSGPPGQLLNSLLRHVGLNREECYVTTVFPLTGEVDTFLTSDEKLAARSLPFAPKRWIHRDYAGHLDALDVARETFNPTCIIALGGTALWALTGRRDISRHRGTPMMTLDTRHKVIATWHPSAILRDWSLRPIALIDLQKAKRNAEFVGIRRPRRFIHIDPSLSDLDDFYDEYIVPAAALSVDIETQGGQITEIGFAPTPDRALVVPFYSRAVKTGNYWPTFEQERAAWSWVRRTLAAKPCFGQNFQYDIAYLWRTVRIPVPRVCDDTMLLHHSLEPELKKGLGFLGSIYTDEPAWKLMRRATLKKED